MRRSIRSPSVNTISRDHTPSSRRISRIVACSRWHVAQATGRAVGTGAGRDRTIRWSRSRDSRARALLVRDVSDLATAHVRRRCSLAELAVERVAAKLADEDVQRVLDQLIGEKRQLELIA